jgi:hypothetical protein
LSRGRGWEGVPQNGMTGEGRMAPRPGRRLLMPRAVPGLAMGHVRFACRELLVWSKFGADTRGRHMTWRSPRGQTQRPLGSLAQPLALRAAGPATRSRPPWAPGLRREMPVATPRPTGGASCGSHRRHSARWTAPGLLQLTAGGRAAPLFWRHFARGCLMTLGGRLIGGPGPVFRAGTCRLPQIGTKPGDEDQETPRNTGRKTENVDPGVVAGALVGPFCQARSVNFVSRGVGNPRLVEAGPGRMPKRSRIFGPPSDPGMTFRCCISGISTRSHRSPIHNSHPQFPHFSGR